MPALITWLFIWVLPRQLFIRSFRKEREYKHAKQIELIKFRRMLAEEDEALAKQSAKALKAKEQAVIVEKRVTELDPSRGFEKDYKEFLKRPAAELALNEIKITIYKHYGFIGTYQNPSSGDYNVNDVDPNLLALAHTNDLIEFDNPGTHITLTSKGKDFISRLS